MSRKNELEIAGWREWVSLPELGIKHIKAKLDTGARSSSLHAFDLTPMEVDGRRVLRFKVQPRQHSAKIVQAEAPLIDVREIRSSSGQVSKRYIVSTRVKFRGQSWDIELSLADRSDMKFRMLLGREGIRGRMLVDSGKSFYGPRPKRKHH